MIVVPSWREHVHRSDDGAVLFRVTDEPVMQKLGFLREGNGTRPQLHSADCFGAGEQRRRQSEPERCGGLQIDDEIELGRLRHRQARLASCREESG